MNGAYMLGLLLVSAGLSLVLVLLLTWDKYLGYHRLIVGYTFRHFLWDRRHKAFRQYITIQSVLILVMMCLYYLMTGVAIFSPPLNLIDW